MAPYLPKNDLAVLSLLCWEPTGTQQQVTPARLWVGEGVAIFSSLSFLSLPTF